MHQPLKTFIIYASADRDLREELEDHLIPLVDAELLHLWSDKQILPGEEWNKAIETQLAAAELFVMLVSSSFFKSEYIRHTEFKQAIDKMQTGNAIVLPVIVKPCAWEHHPIIRKLQVLPHGGLPIVDTEHWNTRDKGWKKVLDGIATRIEHFWEEKKKAAEAEARRLAAEKTEAERQKKEDTERVPATALSRRIGSNLTKSGMYTKPVESELLHTEEITLRGLKIIRKVNAELSGERYKGERNNLERGVGNSGNLRTPSSFLEGIAHESSTKLVEPNSLGQSRLPKSMDDDHFKALGKPKSKEQAVGEVIGLLQSPAKRISAQITSAGGKLTGLIKSLNEHN